MQPPVDGGDAREAQRVDALRHADARAPALLLGQDERRAAPRLSSSAVAAARAREGELARGVKLAHKRRATEGAAGRSERTMISAMMKTMMMLNFI